MNPARGQDELQEILCAMREGEATTAQHERLTALVAGDPQLAARYVEYVQLCAHLQWQLGSISSASHPAQHAVRDPSVGAGGTASRAPRNAPSIPIASWFARLGRPTHLALALSVLVVLGIALGTWMRREPALAPVAVTAPSATPAEPAIVAELVRTVDAKWEQSTHHAPRDGNFTRSAKVTMALRAGQDLRLTAGLAEIRFTSGASLVLEAPSTFVVESDNAGRLTVGKLAATVPPAATGFTIHTDTSTITDLGTEFGVVVKAGARDSSTEVHVFQGKVDVAQATVQSEIKNLQSEILTAGQAIRMETQVAHSGVFAAEPERFTRTLARVAAHDGFDDAVIGVGLDRHAGGSGWRGAWFTWSHPRRNKPSWQAGIGPGSLVAAGLDAAATTEGGRAQMIGAGNPSYWWARRFEPIGDAQGAGTAVYLTALVRPESDIGYIELVAQEAVVERPAAALQWTIGGKFAVLARPSGTEPPMRRDSTVRCEAGRTRRVVLKVVFSGDPQPEEVSVFVDPPAVEPEKPDAVVDTVNLGNVEQVLLRQGVFDVDEIIVSDQWPLVPTPLPVKQRPGEDASGK